MRKASGRMHKQTQQKANILPNFLDSFELQHAKIGIMFYSLPQFVHLFEDDMLSKIRVSFPTFPIKPFKSS